MIINNIGLRISFRTTFIPINIIDKTKSYIMSKFKNKK